ncbi:4'-phosphopantetheinyl transferase superfamily protein [Actinocrinis puniceicyclus]|uniref:4'-phosphopantetheinyl transferase superfamily protein n=1 Tax=Actinocrinis puniceicyclus TaxID=977794 RepID=A0A8J7WQP6_9ACTN|nr:4'-phosphopantetheinyl transferase superfamily protein [Actinocrinis puniceicyclus]MBS2963694.1 4'-phosphopantetheinyl transferase superfamily protein [Actinocrinis puniceicyclus]
MDSNQTPPARPRRRGPGRALIEEIVPPPAECADTREDLDEQLLPGEHEYVARAVPSRRAEFVTARACARLALARLGVPPGPILSGGRGEPLWPRGIIGSITHCAGYRAAVVARSVQIAGLGIDAEPNAALPGGVLEAVSLPRERLWVDRLARTRPAVRWDRLLFCAKESVYKTWYPLTRRWLDFEDAAIAVDPEQGQFTARLLTAGPVLQGRELTELTGRWVVRDELILTAIVLCAAGAAQRPPAAEKVPVGA